MNTALLVARLLLAAVFLVAALTKLADRPGSRQAVVAFGAPEDLASVLALALPLAELAVAAALLPAASARHGALGALALLLVFAVAISRSMIRGESPDCHCFGQLHSEPAGPTTLARNGLLAAVAGFVAVAGWSDSAPSAIAWVGRLDGAGTVALVGGTAIVLLAAAGSTFMLALLRQNGRLLLRIDQLEARLDGGDVPASLPPQEYGLRVGSPAPSFALSGLYGETVTLEALLANEKPVLLLFTDPSCGPCNALLPQIAAWQHEHADALLISVISRGSVADNRSKIREHGVTGLWLDSDLTVYNAFQIAGTPGAVVVDQNGTIASGVVGGADAIAALLRHTLGGPLAVVQVPAPQLAPQPQPQAPRPPGIGERAPSVDLLDLDGQRVRVRAKDQDTLVLFWNPGCGFCKRMIEDLRAWEQAPPATAPRLLLVSTGDVESNRAMGLRAPILLDSSFATASSFGAGGTPSAILVDRRGLLAPELGVGAPAVMALASGERTAQPT